uniref:16S rRNA (guanine(527)-N(7))-methyltransferase RsmG n=1 Tax=Chelativorans sp. YIM 93263 TaxID=2906648 RepID=UPI002378CFBE|nr:16S rRNA (guanine(527)-N(7))-methyltransferase RsmG [Chelativorans sp. YIM 93263]
MDEVVAKLEIATGRAVSRETLERLLAFEKAFRRWASRINLAAPSTLPHLWERHILDSAQLIRLAPDARGWVDLGSGGGFPGAVVALLLADQPKTHVDLVESNHKKAAFLSTTLAELYAPARVHACRIEESYSRVPAPEVVTARALAPLPRLLRLAQPWISGSTRALLHKGRDYRSEIEESGNEWRFDLVEHEPMFGGDGAILEISRLRGVSATT